MSYDVYLAAYAGDQEIPVTDAHNYTYNISEMLETALGGVRLNSLNGKPAVEAAEHLQIAINALTANPERYDAMNATNGWGSRVGCIKWLKNVVADCERYPLATFRVA